MAFASSLTRFRGETALLIGSGALAADLIVRLIEVGARVRWFSPSLDVAEEIGLGRQPDRIEVAFREPRAHDFAEAAAVIAAVDEPRASRIAEQARALGRPVVVPGRPDLSTFDLDDTDIDTDDGGSGDLAPARLGGPPRRAGEGLLARLARGMSLLATALAASSSV